MFKRNIADNILIFFAIFATLNIYAANESPSNNSKLAPSDFQKNGAIIKILESGVQDFIKVRETEDLNYGLHLIGFDGIAIDNPQTQFITDYSRTSCNQNSLQSNLQECRNAINGYYYTLIRPSNIFESLNYKQPIELNASIGVAHSLIDPFPSTKLNSLLKDKQTAINSKNEIASLIASQVPMMMAKNSINGIIARRYVDPDTMQKLPSNYTAKSILEMMHDESTRRLTDADWFNNLNNLPVNQLLMELLQVEAFKLWMEYNKFQQNERIEALLATLLSSQAGQANAISSMVSPEDKEAMKENKAQFESMKDKASGSLPSEFKPNF
jgi:hypothetical protein